ncbi:nucleotide-binding protein [uncultured Clostridium sp.]|jgi:predicted nucleotide-binding protein|uniref:nucleotide-binding protein n=1 Tax=uncultured Clostridium sp. TaxID=59620 RepID=UPI00262F007C|nr:nucleotide-binding protein [uncultured Clostridium sp.]
MNIIKKLKLDVDGIVGTIDDYTSEAYVKNICDGLKSSINKNDLGEIGYFLQKLKDWYEENQSKIQSSDYVHNKRLHIKIEKEIPSYMEELDIYIKERKDIVENELAIDDIEKRGNKVFIVHGHDELALEQVVGFIKDIKLDPIVLKNQASLGNTIIEKIEEYSDVGFAIVLYTPCDIGASINDKDNMKNRARQNVVFEHGYLIGKLGRRNVCALVKSDIEKPNDISGIVYIELDNQKAWRFNIARDMKKLGYDIDLNNLI